MNTFKQVGMPLKIDFELTLIQITPTLYVNQIWRLKISFNKLCLFVMPFQRSFT